MPEALTPGPELDARVAAACGATPVFSFVPPNLWKFADGKRVNQDDWRPSTDLNAAFEAAEKVGLFAPRNNITVWKIHDDWRASFNHDNGRGFTCPTLPLALCAAILALHPPKEST